MKRHFLFCIILSIGINAGSQTIVSTSPENRNALIEEFTGIGCGFCPYGHLEVANFIAAHPNDGFAIAMHQGYFAIPGPGQPDYSTDSGDGLGSYFSVSSWPGGLINRHDFGSGLIYPLNEWQQYASQVLIEGAYVNVACEATVDAQTRELTVHVETYYTGNSPEASNYLNVALIQNNVKGPQFSSWFNPDAITPDGAYMHQHMLRDLITDQWGEEISPTTTGTFIDKVYTYTIPESIKDVPVRLGDLSIVSFIVETEKEVENVHGAHPELTNFVYALDAGIDELQLPESSCSYIDSKVVIGNFGSEIINSISFEIQVNNEEPETFIWDAELIEPFTAKEIEIPPVFYGVLGTANYSITIASVNGISDENPSNNTAEASFEEAIEVALPIYLHLETDNYFGTAWYLYDDQNNLIQQGSGYDYNSSYDILLEVDACCYKFEMTDLDGFFFGSYSLMDGNNNTFFSREGNFGNSEVTAFTLPIYAPTAVIDASTTVACIGGTIQFMDGSTGGPTEWEWTFEGGDPASSTEKNPLISYSQAGSYDVTLTVTNTMGTDEVTIQDFITITSLSYGNLALEFDGMNDYVEITNESAFDFTEAISLEAWIKPAMLSGIQGVMSKNFGNNAHPYQIRLVNDEVLFGFYSNTIGWQPVQTSSANLQIGEWVHIACTYNMQYVKIYINGEQKASVYKSFEIPLNDQPVEIGRSKDVYYEYFSGIIDEVRIWDIALGQQEVLENMCTNYAGSGNENLIAYYKFNECGGTLLTDVQNAYDGVLVGMEGDEWIESDACPVYSVNFFVTEDLGTVPIEGATVNMSGTIRYTDENGQANYEGYEPWSYEYSVFKEMYSVVNGSFELVDEDITIDVEIQGPHFVFEGGDPSSPLWSIYIAGAISDGENLVAGDQIAIFDGDVMVGLFNLDQTCTPENQLENDLTAFSILVSGPGYQAGNSYTFKCWDASEDMLIENFEIELFNPYGDAYTGDVFPAGDSEYSIVALDFSSSASSQTFNLSFGFQFISSGVNPDDPDMVVVMTDILNDNLDFVRNSQGQTLRKIGPNWVNGIGDWIVDEGYLVKMYADDSFTSYGTQVDPATPISVETGFQFVSYFPENAMDALDAFATIIGDDLDFIRDSEGTMIRKIGPNWVNGIGDCQSGEGYLVKMFASGEIIYPASAKSSGKTTIPPFNFIFEGGNPAEAVYSLYLEGLEIGDEVAAFIGDKMIGAVRINSHNVFENELPVFSTLMNGQGYKEGNQISLKVWSENNIFSADFTMESIYDSYVSDVYPEGDGKYSVVNITKGEIENIEETISIYPNPTSGLITISNLSSFQNLTALEITDIAGKTVFQSKIKNQKSKMIIDLSDIENGVYFLSFSGKNFKEVKRIVIK